MAKALCPLDQRPTLLGFQDEVVPDSAPDVDFTTSKIGGKPNFPSSFACGDNGFDVRCDLCGHLSSLVVQIYAPLERSNFHRTLYVFACLQPDCWNKSQSWTCLRIQTPASTQSSIPTPSKVQPVSTAKTTDWLDDADDWGDEEEETEENGNIDNTKNLNLDKLTLSPTPDNLYSPSPDVSTSSASEEMPSTSHGLTEDDDNNGNFENGNIVVAKAAGAADPLIGTAEIEVDDGRDVIAVDDEEVEELRRTTQVPQLLMSGAVGGVPLLETMVPELNSYYLYVEEELVQEDNQGLTEHERQLLLEYKAKESQTSRTDTPRGSGGGKDDDEYEKSLPRHGDVWFHKFISVIQNYPGQLLRYTQSPLFLSKPSSDALPRKCRHCRSPVKCELQILPSLISTLGLKGHGEERISVLEFGTVIVFSCSESCWSNCQWRKENVFVQAETM